MCHILRIGESSQYFLKCLMKFTRIPFLLTKPRKLNFSIVLNLGFQKPSPSCSTTLSFVKLKTKTPILWYFTNNSNGQSRGVGTILSLLFYLRVDFIFDFLIIFGTYGTCCNISWMAMSILYKIPIKIQAKVHNLWYRESHQA